ncbi:hypothetical protein ABW20_dc0107413 [Dactylellina cionopaga]|nr:hypothetical protein ABW20_dc0107413 [Dactylellina cionopaga]
MQLLKSLFCFKSQPNESVSDRVSSSCFNFLRYGRRRPTFNLNIFDDTQNPRSLRASIFVPSGKRGPTSRVSPIDDDYPPPPPEEYRPAPTPSRISEKDRNVDRNETYILNHPFFGNSADEMLIFSLGNCHLDTVNHPDYLTITMLDSRNLAELEISISRFSRKVTFNQQNPNEIWKKEHVFDLEELFSDGEINQIQIWTEQRFTSDNYIWYEYMVKTPRRVVATEIMCFSRSPKVRFLQIFERTDPPMLQQSHIEVSHYNHHEEVDA